MPIFGQLHPGCRLADCEPSTTTTNPSQQHLASTVIVSRHHAARYSFTIIDGLARTGVTMSLNNVINNLVRAQASVPSDISDADLNAHVARLLASEARDNEAKWSELGLGAYLANGRDS